MTSYYLFIAFMILLGLWFISVRRQVQKSYEFKIHSRQKIKAIHRPPTDPKIRVA